MLKPITPVVKHVLTITQGMTYYFAVHMWLNEDDKKAPFWEPYVSGLGRYDTPAEAIVEAVAWAEETEMQLDLKYWTPTIWKFNPSTPVWSANKSAVDVRDSATPRNALLDYLAEYRATPRPAGNYRKRATAIHHNLLNEYRRMQDGN
jgi:hypothetical protein